MKRTDMEEVNLPFKPEYPPKEMFIHKEMKVDHPKIVDMLDNWEQYIDYLCNETEKALARKLRIVQMQMQMALEQKLFVEVDTLYLFEKMIVFARVYRMKYNLDPDDDKPKRSRKPKEEKKIEEEIISNENPDASELSEERSETFNETSEETEEDNKPDEPQQLSLF